MAGIPVTCNDLKSFKTILKTKRIDFTGITKSELHKKITSLLDKYNKDIAENNISISKQGDVYNISGSLKKFLFTFSVKGEIQIFDNYIIIYYDTDIPESFQGSGFNTIETEINNAQLLLRKDYIMRMIEEFVRVIARVVLLKETKKYVEAKTELDNLSILVLGFGLEHLKSLGSRGINYIYSLNKETEIEKLYCSAKILKEDGLILEAEGRNEESLKSFNLSKELFELISDKDFDEKNESLNELEFLKNKITQQIAG